MKTALCVVCRGEFSDEETRFAKACPACGDKGIPADLTKKASIALTHHEWRIIGMWAHNYATQVVDKAEAREIHTGEQVVEAILREVKRQAPELPPLTLKDELALAGLIAGVADIELDGEPIKKETLH